MGQLGMIAGAGELPTEVARQAQLQGQFLPTVALSAPVATALAPYCPTLRHYGPGQLRKIIRTLQQYHVNQVIIVGKVEKQFFFENPRLDFRLVRRLAQLPDYQDITLLRALVTEFATEGLEVVEQTRLLGHLLTPAGVLGTWSPKPRHWQDIAYGFIQARQLAAMDIGQTLVVRRRTILAVEALEGTDATIRRGCQYGQHDSVVVKVSRPQQDMRFDVPTIGPNTLQEVINGGARVLAIEAGKTLSLRLQELITTANAHRVVLVGVSPTVLQQQTPEGQT
jgi:DUF1009 family protein